MLRTTSIPLEKNVLKNFNKYSKVPQLLLGINEAPECVMTGHVDQGHGLVYEQVLQDLVV